MPMEEAVGDRTNPPAAPFSSHPLTSPKSHPSMPARYTNSASCHAFHAWRHCSRDSLLPRRR
ncbi:hypothetical protein I7I53_12222 [Histoplasma capsulatum var. duboisii H88]|uniref:Uncharacterized protein n=1 Tax=Ajellomyces capsulatus (strain H88) TaxID=544711 RepID=A0A8A1LZD8_AJEC8|nr:hypothetical protein I7I53_12222 [Histoplasma capsulatum var. duboisii H88]